MAVADADPRVGHRLPGRMLVEQGGPAHPQYLLRGDKARPPPPTVGRQGRARPQSHLLLRALSAPARRDVDKVRRREARKLYNDAVPLVVREELGAAGKKTLLLIWENASWHTSKEVRRWLGRHNRRIKKSALTPRARCCWSPESSRTVGPARASETLEGTKICVAGASSGGDTRTPASSRTRKGGHGGGRERHRAESRTSPRAEASRSG